MHPPLRDKSLELSGKPDWASAGQAAPPEP